jgi:hypothetical protein
LPRVSLECFGCDIGRLPFCVKEDVETIIHIFGTVDLQFGKPQWQRDVALPIANAHDQFVKDAAVKIHMLTLHQRQRDA